MKVCLVLDNIDKTGGGPSRSVPTLANGLSRVGIKVTLLALKSADMNIHLLEDSNVEFIAIDRHIGNRELEKIIVSRRFDIIHQQGMWVPIYHRIAIIARNNRIPYIMTPRGMLEPWCLTKNKWKKRLALALYQMRDINKSACVFSTAESEADNLRALGVKVPISVIPNGLEIDDYPCRNTSINVKKQVLFLSRIGIKKGIEVLIDAWRVISSKYADWQLLIVGNGSEDYIATLNDIIKKQNLSHSIMIKEPAFGKQKTRLYQESSLFCLPSYSENFGMVIAEAMSCGVPAITTTNTPWILLNGEISTMGAKVSKKTGWCIELSKENLITALDEAMSLDKDILFKMGQDASLLIHDNFDIRNVAIKVKKLYHWICGEGSIPEYVKEF